MEIRPLPLNLIDESTTNPRKHFDPEKLKELSRSLRERGMQQPVKVRPKGSRYELIFGARRVRAARLIHMVEVPGIVENLSDEEVLELQITENAQREDVHPLEEADAYHTLNKQYGRSVIEIAAKVGKSTSHIYQRMTLASLRPVGRGALLAGTIDAGTALILARINDDAMQDKATSEVIRGVAGHPLRLTEARSLVREKYMLVLARAPFDAAALDLVPAAGACGPCPKRTGNQAELFADLGKTDLCTDPGCYATKVSAAWEKEAERAQRAGAVVLPDKTAAKVFGGGTIPLAGSGYIDLDSVDHYNPSGKTHRNSLGKSLKDVQVVVARDGEGRKHELVAATAVARAAHAVGKVPPPVGKTTREAKLERVAPTPAKSTADAEKQARDRAKAGKEYRSAVVTAIVEKAAKSHGNAAFWRTMSRAAQEVAHKETTAAIEERRGGKVNVAKLSPDEHALFVFEVLLTQGALYTLGDSLPPRITAAALDLGVNVMDVRRDLIAAAAKRRTK